MIVVVTDSVVVEQSISSEKSTKGKIKKTVPKSSIEHKENQSNREITTEKIKKTDVLESLDFTEENISVLEPEPLRTELIAFYKSVKKTPETIEINNEKEAIITCKEGTKLTIPAKAFIDEKTGKLARGKIKLNVIEYYELSDMLLANLSTRSDDKILETGGMLNIEASKKGSKLKLKIGKRIKVIFPNKGKNNMQLFSGKGQAHELNWKLQEDKALRNLGATDSTLFIEEDIIIAGLLDESVEVPIAIVEEVPIFPGCENGTQLDKKTCLKDKITSIIENNFNKSIAENLNLVGNHKITVAFKINKEGIIDNIEVFASHTKLAEEALRVVELVPQMLPARQRNRTVITPYSIPIYFSVGRSTKNNPSLIKVEGRTTFERSINTRLGIRDSLSSATNTSGISKDTLSSNEVARYAFSTSQLGWINCDRFIKSKGKFKYKVKIKNADGANVKMVFKSLSSILPSKAYHNEFDFGIIPAKEQVILVAIKEINGQFYLAIHETETIFNPKVNLEFKQVTINELKSELKKLNTLFN